MPKKETITSLQQAKGERKITMITAYDALFASLFRESADMILVGDSLNMSFKGEPDTLSITLEQMIYHTQAVCNGAPDTFVVCDMPFGSTNTKEEALANAVKVFQQTRADAVKIEGGCERADLVEHLTDNAIAVIGHVGLLPQSVRSEGGYKVKGRDEESFKQVMADAKAIEESGAFALVIEGVTPALGKAVTEAVKIPVIGIGAGKETDGQVLVWSDMLGFFEAFKPKFVKRYLEGAKLVKEAVGEYAKEVRSGIFPAEEHTYK
ncbi:3-methyl-2-oxobutanoate hydroxymethyltransferase [Hydrogenimonas cancrithermarum]|uniref:3-methyl-2-oxobutanoate hydroxymethyltransferase n=1 Tax=Hydrogenimonas cancrithermarum TaxID=2993563 RepID=A0ABM8FJZ1_9BACT|nr:3-methyl-2-oxobutanoate hydroxymethyltransferase [Hydrogenimonas cancrithermarum]BDY12629.1 3-methyl-2-oxobutanoate hydroxymethyltransferase [Hydrogenimonas cancrithermarum]